MTWTKGKGEKGLHRKKVLRSLKVSQPRKRKRGKKGPEPVFRRKKEFVRPAPWEKGGACRGEWDCALLVQVREASRLWRKRLSVYFFWEGVGWVVRRGSGKGNTSTKALRGKKRSNLDQKRGKLTANARGGEKDEPKGDSVNRTQNGRPWQKKGKEKKFSFTIGKKKNLCTAKGKTSQVGGKDVTRTSQRVTVGETVAQWRKKASR